MQLKKLEEEIGFSIFDRNRKPVEPTLLGNKFIERAKIIVEEAHLLKNFVNEDINTFKGKFRFGIIPTVAPYLLPLFLPDFVKKYPDTHLIIKEMHSEDIIKELKNGTLDLAVLATPLEEKTLLEEPVYYEPFLAYFPPKHPRLKADTVDMEDLDLRDLLVLAEGHCFRNQTLRICNVNSEIISHEFTYESGSIEAVKRMIDKGFGYSLIPALAIDSSYDLSRIREFNMPVPSREVSIVSYKSFHKYGLINALKKTVLDNVPDDFVKNENFIRINWRTL